MANLALVTADTVRTVSFPVYQDTLPAAEAIEAGAPVRLDATAGKWTNANGSSTTENRFQGIALRSVAAGESVTAVRGCWIDGFDIAALNFGALVYLSDTDGTLADSAGTVSTVIGSVQAGPATTLGTTFDKLLYVKAEV